MSGLGNKEIMSKNIKHYMRVNGKTRQDICRDLGFQYTTFVDWEKGVTYPRIDNIELMANYFRIQKSDLIEDRDSAASPAVPKEFYLAARKMGEITEEQRQHIFKQLDSTIDIFLAAKRSAKEEK